MTLLDFISRLENIAKKVASDTQVHVSRDIFDEPLENPVFEYFDIFQDNDNKRVVIAPSGKWDRRRKKS